MAGMRRMATGTPGVASGMPGLPGVAAGAPGAADPSGATWLANSTCSRWYKTD